MLAEEDVLKEAGRSENYEKITNEIKVFEEFNRWGLCDKCEKRLTGRFSTQKPQDLICLGCDQTGRRQATKK